MFKHLLVALGLGLSVAGCTYTVDSPQQSYAGTKVVHDKYAGTNDVTGLTLSGSVFPTVVQSKYLAGQVDRDGNAATWLYVAHDESNLNVFESAHDAQAQRLHTKAFSRVRGYVDGFSHEEVAVYFPDGYLASHAATGLDIRLEGRHGAIVVTVPALYVQGYLAKLTEVEACTKAKTC